MDFLTKNKLVERYIFPAPWRTCVFLHANRLRYLICVHTDAPPLINLGRVHTYTECDGVSVGCTDFHTEGKKSTFPEVQVAFNYGRRPVVASIRPDSREFFNPRQIRVTHRPTAGQAVRVYARAECNVRVARLNRYISTARPIEMVDRDRDRLVVFLFRFIDVSLSKLTNSPLRSFSWKSFSALFFHHRNLISARFLAKHRNSTHRVISYLFVGYSTEFLQIIFKSF